MKTRAVSRGKHLYTTDYSLQYQRPVKRPLFVEM